MYNCIKIACDNNHQEIKEILESKGYELNFKLTDNPCFITTGPSNTIAFWNFEPKGCFTPFETVSFNQLKDIPNVA